MTEDERNREYFYATLVVIGVVIAAVILSAAFQAAGMR